MYNDILLADPNLTEFNSLKEALNSAFCIKNLGELKFFLGLKEAQSTRRVSICQRKYCLELLETSGTSNCKPASTPLDPAIKLSIDDSPYLSDVAAYRRLVGQLIYVTTTRPDITHPTQQLIQYMSSPTENHHKVAMRVLRYLKNAPSCGILFP